SQTMSTLPSTNVTTTVEVTATFTRTTETISTDSDGLQKTTTHEVRTDATATMTRNDDSATGVDAVSTGNPLDEANEALSENEARTERSSPSDISEHPDLPEDDGAPKVSIVRHIERTERTIIDGELAAESLTVGKAAEDEDDFSIEQLLLDMTNAGLEPRGPPTKRFAPKVDKEDPIKKAVEEAKQKAAIKEAKQKAEMEEAKKKAAQQAKADAAKKASKSG
ncbi:hypothetical protein BDY19DRAFT_939657, partial [Irpex rosettiformis]